jgi:TonB-dependent starch-binding outer membrane protein SusC
MKKVLMALSFLMVFGIQALLAQTRTINGTITDAGDGNPLAGVSVNVKGSTNGTITSSNGSFSLSIPQSANALVLKFIGMKTKEVALTQRSSYSLMMEASENAMNEVIVTGYGVSRKESNTGSLGVVSSKDLQGVPEVSFDKMLSGKIAGVMVTGVSGQPGAATEIRIRGISSINAGNDPLYVIDGIPMMSVTEGIDDIYVNSNNPLASINPNDIESVTVLKDAAAASIYGSRAANGVILITTKSGKAGKTVVKLRATAGVTALANDNNYNIMNPLQLNQYMRDAVVNAGINPDDPTAGGGKYYVPRTLLGTPQTNWLDAVSRNGSIHEYEVSVSGGNEKTKHFTSALYSKTQGVFYGIDYKKMQLRSNLEHKISDKFTIGTKINLSNSITNDLSMQSLYYANPLFAGLTIVPSIPVKNADGTYNLKIPKNSNTNPLATAAYDDQWDNRYHAQIAAFAQWEITKGLTFKTNNAFEYIDGDGRRFWSKEADYAGVATLQVTQSKYTQVTSSNTLSYNTSIMDKHNFSGILGQEVIDNKDNYFYIYSPNVNPQIPFPNTGVASTDRGGYGETEYTMLSLFGIADYNYDAKYYLKLSLRSDGSSKFGSNNRWGTFYSVGSSWNIHNESFMSDVKDINVLKLRASYGVNGNDNIDTYEQWGIYSANQYNGASGMFPDQPDNKNLTWEVNKSFDIGVDFTVFDRVSGTFDYYSRKTTDMLLDVPLSSTSGFEKLRQNIGSLRNRGVEALINVKILDGNVKWDVGANLAHNKSKILSLGKDDQFIDPNNARLIYKVGESLYNFYIRDYAGVNPANGEALWKDEDGKITSNYAAAPRKIMGSPEPKLMGGFNTTVGWNGLSLNLNFEFKYGNKVLIEENHYLNSDGFNWGSNQTNSALDYWKKPGDVTRNPKPIADNTSNSYGYYNSRWMFDGSYLRLKNLTLAYDLPKSLTQKAKMSGVRIYTSAVNLYTFHKVDYFDPERGSDGTGMGIYPMTKSLVAGLEITF